MLPIILATTSHYRILAFNSLGFEFSSEPSYVDEKISERPNNIPELVQYLAKLKAQAVASKHPNEDVIIIGFDSAGYISHLNQIMEKPESRQEAFERLENLSGKSHEFYTGVHMINPKTKKQLTRLAQTNVLMRNYSEQEIKRYLDQDSKVTTCALGYDPQMKFYSASFVKDLQGSYQSLLCGLPLEIITEMLFEITSDLNIPQKPNF